MTTITINQKIKLSKTHFLNIEELMQELINLYNLSNSNQKKWLKNKYLDDIIVKTVKNKKELNEYLNNL